MKKFRKIMAVLVAAMMIISSFTLTAFAAEDSGRLSNGGSIVIKEAQDGETYHAYEIFALLSFTDDENITGDHSDDEHYSYGLLKGGAWQEFFTAGSTRKTSAFTKWGSDYIAVDWDHPITVGTKFYYPVKMKDGTNSSMNFSGMDDEADRDDAISGLTSTSPATTAGGVQAFARLALQYASTYSVPASATASNGGSPDTGASTTPLDTPDTTHIKVTFSGLELGYYLIDSSVGTLCALDTTNKSATTVDKNDIPTIDKKVLKYTSRTATRATSGDFRWADEGTIFVTNTEASIGDTVKFLITIDVPKYAATPYVLYDVMEDGFINPANVAVFYTDPADTTKMKAAANTDYTSETPAYGCDLIITLNEALLRKLDTVEGAKIQIDYTAELSKSAEIYGETRTADSTKSTVPKLDTLPASVLPSEITASAGGSNTTQVISTYNGNGTNDNYAILTYGANSSTTWSSVNVDTYAFDVIKMDESNKLLAGAKFKVYRGDASATADTHSIPQLADGATALGFVSAATLGALASNANSAPSTYLALPDSTQSGATSEFTTDGTNKLNFRGLVSGTYYVQESEAPLGYDAIPGLIKVVVTGGDGAVANEGKITITQPGIGATAGDPTDWMGTVSSSTWSSGGVPVVNTTSKELPSTGGMGTTVLYIVGGMLVILAGAYLFFSRKRTA